MARACDLLADGGIPLGSQTVLLRGVNDDVQALKDLFHALLRIRVRPYYLYQCDPVVGTGHLRTTVRRGMELMSGLRGHTTRLRGADLRDRRSRAAAARCPSRPRPSWSTRTVT